VANIASQDMSDGLWLSLARRVNVLLAREDTDGIVITHGTDTLEETAFFLHLVKQGPKPVVLTGAMRSATSLSADGPLNLFNSVAVAAHPAARGRGVMVVMNDAVHGARDVTKTHTTRLETFSSLSAGRLGTVHYGEVQFLRSDPRPFEFFGLEGVETLPRVDVLVAHANFRGDLVDAAVEKGAKGIVVAGVGNGNLTAEGIEALARAVKKEVVVVRSTRIPEGPVFRNHEIDDDALGFVAAGHLKPAKARILLKLALHAGLDRGEIQRLFHRF
jgi:L-asparaginase